MGDGNTESTALKLPLYLLPREGHLLVRLAASQRPRDLEVSLEGQLWCRCASHERLFERALLWAAWREIWGCHAPRCVVGCLHLLRVGGRGRGLERRVLHLSERVVRHWREGGTATSPCAVLGDAASGFLWVESG